MYFQVVTHPNEVDNLHCWAWPSPESARDCLKWPSFNCLNHFYKMCVTLPCLKRAIFLLDHRGSTKHKHNKYQSLHDNLKVTNLLIDQLLLSPGQPLIYIETMTFYLSSFYFILRFNYEVDVDPYWRNSIKFKLWLFLPWLLVCFLQDWWQCSNKIKISTTKCISRQSPIQVKTWLNVA